MARLPARYVGPLVATGNPSAEANPQTSPALALPDKPSVAVLPFSNLSGDPKQEYFADGMVENIIAGLSCIKCLFVVARNSSFTYKEETVDVKRVGRELGVRYLFEGSLRKDGNRLRISAQMIEAETGGHLWAERYDRPLGDIFALHALRKGVKCPCRRGLDPRGAEVVFCEIIKRRSGPEAATNSKAQHDNYLIRIYIEFLLNSGFNTVQVNSIRWVCFQQKDWGTHGPQIWRSPSTHQPCAPSFHGDRCRGDGKTIDYRNFVVTARRPQGQRCQRTRHISSGESQGSRRFPRRSQS